MRFAIVVDGTASLPEDAVRAHDIHWLPLRVILNDEAFVAATSPSDAGKPTHITTAEFYERIRPKDVRPETSAPNIEEALTAYDLALATGAREMLVLTIATELSATHSVAATTAQQCQDRARIEVVDTRSVAGGISLIATACARLRERGGSFDDAVALARGMAGTVQILAAADQLEYLRRSGRVSGGAALFGTLLAVKPILEVANGVVHPIDRVRTRDKAVARLKDLIAKRTAAGTRIHACVLHTNDPDRARTLGEWVQETYHCVEYFLAEAGPVIGARAGPGLIGLCWYAEGTAA
ncbi:MAG TPA: DegV family protein [Candidatus Limnocylindria bacterium]